MIEIAYLYDAILAGVRGKFVLFHLPPVTTRPRLFFYVQKLA
jgi:hypothetical protein